MGWNHECDDCGETFADDRSPFLMGQFNEGAWLSQAITDRIQGAGYSLEDTVTLCGPCTFKLLGDLEAIDG